MSHPDDPAPDHGHDHDEYASLEVSAGWPVLSLVFFLAALAARLLVRLVPLDVVGYPWRVALPGLAVPVLCGLGLLLGLFGLRGSQGRGLAKLAILLNAVGLVLGLLFLFAFVYILRR